MFGALAGKLLVEGRRPILLNHCVPANHSFLSSGGGGTANPESILKISKEEFTPNLHNIITSQFPQLFQICFYYFELYIIFLKATLK